MVVSGQPVSAPSLGPNSADCIAGKKLRTNQYSVTEYDTPARTGELQLPSVWFMYDLSPVTVAMAQTRRSLLHLITRFCAIVGGVFAVTGDLSPCMASDFGVQHAVLIETALLCMDVALELAA